MTARVIGSGLWESNGSGVLMTSVFHPTTQLLVDPVPQPQPPLWRIGQIVDVRPRTWAGLVSHDICFCFKASEKSQTFFLISSESIGRAEQAG
jgi:hypothetical protein